MHLSIVINEIGATNLIHNDCKLNFGEEFLYSLFGMTPIKIYSFKL